jgi:hypothetical protein
MIKRLKDEASSDYILNLVESIEADLLQVDSNKRAKIDQVVKKFSRIDNNCREKMAYCTTRTPATKAGRTAIIAASYSEQSALEAFLGLVFGFGKARVTVSQTI